MRKKNIDKLEWDCLYWDSNSNRLEITNVIRDDLFEDISKAKKNGKLNNRDDLSVIVREWAMYHYWSKAEWEIVVSDLFGDKEEKIDVYSQLVCNWDRFLDYIVKEVQIEW